MSEPERILIIDGYNTFIRSYVVNPAIDNKGNPIGGCYGFLKSLQKEVRETKADHVVIAWDGSGGSKRRKLLHKEYKEGRKPPQVRLNRNIDQGLTPEQMEENKLYQFTRLIEYLNQMPVIQFMFDGVEADDIISHICRMRQNKGKLKFIVSMDKDFLQLCNDETILCRPVQKEILNTVRVLQKFGIHPNNFALARAIAGDKSDNIEGIKGVGLPTVAKRLPILAEEKSVTIDELLDYCEETKGQYKVYDSIIEESAIVERNYKLTQLYVPRISPQNTKAMGETFNQFEPEFNKTEVTKMMIVDGLTDYNWDSLFQKFRAIVARNK